MSWRHPTEADWDHERDLRKAESRPDDPRLDAIEIAVLVKQVGIAKGAELIEQYGRTKFSEGAVEATIRTSDRILAVIDHA